MISRVRPTRKNKRTVHGHEAWSDRVLFNQNLNPYREGTPEHDHYNQEYDYADESLRPASELPKEKPHHDL